MCGDATTAMSQAIAKVSELLFSPAKTECICVHTALKMTTSGVHCTPCHLASIGTILPKFMSQKVMHKINFYIFFKPGVEFL